MFKNRFRTKRQWIAVLALCVGLGGLCARAVAQVTPDIRPWTLGTLTAVNEIMGPRSGWSWVNPPEPDRLSGTLRATPGLTQVVNVGDGLTITVTINASGAAQYDLNFHNPPSFHNPPGYLLRDASGTLSLSTAPVSADPLR